MREMADGSRYLGSKQEGVKSGMKWEPGTGRTMMQTVPGRVPRSHRIGVGLSGRDI